MISRDKKVKAKTGPMTPSIGMRPDAERQMAGIDVVHMIGHLRLGAGRYIVDTAVEQVRRFKRRVKVLVSPDADGNWKTDSSLVAELHSAGIGIECAGDFFRRNLKILLQTSTELQSRWSARPNRIVVHAHSAVAAAVARWAGAPAVVATCHGFDPQRPSEYDLQDALAYRLCDAVTTPSKYWAAKLSAELAVPDPSVTPVGLDLGRYPRLKREGKHEDAPLRIVTMCELTERKGVDLLIGAMPKVWKHLPGTELHIIGDGDAAADLRRQSRAFGRDGSRIIFHGFLRNPYFRLFDYDLFALGSRSDNLPVGIIEAMLARLPVVATKVGGISEMVSDGHCGALADPGCNKSLGEVLVSTLKLGRAGLDQLGASGESFARSHFSVRKTAADLQGIYRDVSRNGSQRVSPRRPQTDARSIGNEHEAQRGVNPAGRHAFKKPCEGEKPAELKRRKPALIPFLTRKPESGTK